MRAAAPVLIALLLAGGLALLLVAPRRGWAPPLWVALATGLVLRGTVLALAAARGNAQPEDLAVDFRIAGRSVLHGQDPLLMVPRNGWHFLPLPDYVLAGQYQVHLWLHVPWLVIARVVPVACDLGLVALVGRLALRDGRLRAFQYACNPVAVLIAAEHGQLEPMALLTGVAALLVARRGRGLPAGLLLGLSVAGNSWPVLLLPGVLRTLTGLRDRLVATAATFAVPLLFLLTMPLTMGTRLADVPRVTRQVLGVRPVTGQWGWSALVGAIGGQGGHAMVSPRLESVGTVLILAAVVVVLIRWRHADPVQLTAALLVAFLATTARLGAQYLEWPMPLLSARPTRRTNLAVSAAGVWAAFGYLVLLGASGRLSLDGTQAWTVGSVLVVAALLVALPPTAAAGPDGTGAPVADAAGVRAGARAGGTVRLVRGLPRRSGAGLERMVQTDPSGEP